MSQLRNVAPVIKIYVECSHQHTTRTRNSNGTYSTSTSTVVTHRETRYLPLTGWYDQTPPLCLPNLSKNPLIHLVLTEKVNLMGTSAQIVETQRIIAYNQNRFRDVHCKATVTINVPGNTEHNYL